MRAAPADEPHPIDETVAIVEMHPGNALEAIRTLLAERDAVEKKLRVAAIAMGHGFTRCWRTRSPGKCIGEG